MKHGFYIALILVSTSCVSTRQTYLGEKRPAPEIAVVKFQHAFNTTFTRNVFVTHVDGKEITTKPIDSLELLPGEHVLSVRCKLAFKLFSPNFYSDDLKVNVMAGHSYIVKFKDKQFCLEDIGGNNIVTCGDSAKAGTELDYLPMPILR